MVYTTLLVTVSESLQINTQRQGGVWKSTWETMKWAVALEDGKNRTG